MSRLWENGFEWGQETGEWNARHGVQTFSTTTVRSGTYALRINSLGSGTAKGVRQAVHASTGTGPFFLRFYLRYATAPSAANTICYWNDTDNNTTPLVFLKLNSSGALELSDEDGAIGSASSALSANTWYRIEMKVDNSGGAGACVVEAKIDGTAFATSSTRSIGTNYACFALGGNLAAEAQTTGDWFFDDVALNDSAGSIQNSYPGDGRIIHQLPNGNGDNSGFVGNDGNSTDNYLLVDEVVGDDATTYVESGTANATDDYDLAASPAEIASGDTINCLLIGFKGGVSNGSGADPAIKLRIKAVTGGTVEEGAAITLTSASWDMHGLPAYPYHYKFAIYDLPGASTTAWTKADLDAAQIGVIVSTGDTHLARITNIWLSVDYSEATGTTYTQSVSGGITPTGALARKAKKTISGGITPAGAIFRKTYKVLSGAIAPAGVVLKKVQRLLSGAITPGGALTKRTLKVLAGAMTPSGALARKALKALGGSLTPAGSLARKTLKVLAGALTPAGALIAQKLGGGITYFQDLAGGITPVGSLTRKTFKSLAGSLAPVGTLARKVGKAFAGSIAPVGSLARRTAKAFSGTLAPAGSLIKTARKALAGSVTPTGSLTRLTSKALAGSVTPTGTINRLTRKVLGGILGLAGTLTAILAGSEVQGEAYAREQVYPTRTREQVYQAISRESVYPTRTRETPH